MRMTLYELEKEEGGDENNGDAGSRHRNPLTSDPCSHRRQYGEDFLLVHEADEQGTGQRSGHGQHPQDPKGSACLKPDRNCGTERNTKIVWEDPESKELTVILYMRTHTHTHVK